MRHSRLEFIRILYLSRAPSALYPSNCAASPIPISFLGDLSKRRRLFDHRTLPFGARDGAHSGRAILASPRTRNRPAAFTAGASGGAANLLAAGPVEFRPGPEPPLASSREPG